MRDDDLAVLDGRQVRFGGTAGLFVEAGKVDAVADDRDAVAFEAFFARDLAGDGLGVGDEVICGAADCPERQFLRRALPVHEVESAEHDAALGQARGGDGQDRGVEVVRVDESDATRFEPAGQPPHLSGRLRRDKAVVERKGHGIDADLARRVQVSALEAQRRQLDVEAVDESARQEQRLSFGAAEMEAVDELGDARAFALGWVAGKWAHRAISPARVA